MRLLGEHVPYMVEAYPEGDMRHLSAESALFCRIITDGLLNITFDEKGYKLNPMLPECVLCVDMKRIMIDGEYRNFKITHKIEGNEIEFA